MDQIATVHLDGTFQFAGALYYVGGLFTGQIVAVQLMAGGKRVHVTCPCGNHVRIARLIEPGDAVPTPRVPVRYTCPTGAPAEERRVAA